MIQQHATPEHFHQWECHAKTLDSYSLRYIVSDCVRAAEAMRGWNPAREGYYIDQAATYGMEITRRKRSNRPNLK